jgi:hypothetical protein
MSLYKSVIGITCLAILAGCGGGGGNTSSGSGAITITYGIPTITGTLYQGEAGMVRYEYVTLSSAPANTAVPVIVEDQPVLDAANVTLQATSANTFTVHLPVADTLTVGEHQGTFTLHLYKDSGLTSEYAITNPTLPYDFTVTPLVTAVIKVGGVVVQYTHESRNTDGARIYYISIVPGQTVEVDASKAFVNAWSTLGPASFTGSSVSTDGMAWTGTLNLATPTDTSEMGLISAQDANTGETLKVTVVVNQPG